MSLDAMADYICRYPVIICVRTAQWWLRAMLISVLLLTCYTTARALDLSPQEVKRLLARPSAAVLPSTVDKDDLLIEKLSRVDQNDPAWPIYTFLRAELLIQQQRNKPAAEAYRSLVKYAASNPYKDTWGCDGLTAFALYRWLQLHAAAQATDPAPFNEMVEWADRLLETRLVRSAYRPYAILTSMPLLEEELYHALAVEAQRVGSAKQASIYFLGYLSRVRSKNIRPELDPLYRVMLEQGVSTQDRIALLYGKRLVTQRQWTFARNYLRLAALSKHDQTRLEALYWQARVAGRTMSREERSAVYREVHTYATKDELAQSALLYGGLDFNTKDPEFVNTLTSVVNEYPKGPAADDALRWLAYGARINGQLDRAVHWYSVLRKLRSESPLLGRVAIHVALALLWRGHPQDPATATRVLLDFLDAQPHSSERPRALFWLARIEEQQGRDAKARTIFEETAKAAWFEYYGLRARMHLASGPAARSQLLIKSEALVHEIRAAYEASAAAIAPSPSGGAVYQRRVQTTLSNGLYQLALAGETKLREVDPSTRVQEMKFEELDEFGLVVPIAVTMALRQDALAAADAAGALPDRLALARQLGEAAGDWPAVLSMVHPVAVHPAAKRTELMRTPGYLRTAYPVVFKSLMREAATKYRVAPALLYAVMRQESFFYPAALSSAKALGLFQFIPNTFELLNQEWKLLASGAAHDRAAYLMNARLSIQLGARWFAQKKLPTFGNDLLLAALAHHSSDDVVRMWQAVWKKHEMAGDVEMMIESFRMHDFIPEAVEGWGVEARTFARHVATDIVIVDALQLYPDGPTR